MIWGYHYFRKPPYPTLGKPEIHRLKKSADREGILVSFQGMIFQGILVYMVYEIVPA